jgi:oligopeptide/dipeptide ABC transporter ATP-binding protein
MIAGVMPPSAGELRYQGRRVADMAPRERKAYALGVQMIFQNPMASLNPRMRVLDIVGEAPVVHGLVPAARKAEHVARLLEQVGLDPDYAQRYPHQFSGGQRQRIGIARALALNTKLIIGDEPVSALDVSIQAQVINLLMDLQEERGLSYLFISHDLAVVEHISHRVAVMYLGKLVELADKKDIYLRPLHPYTEALLSAVPVPDPAVRGKKRMLLEGDVPSPINPPKGCRFHTRCPYAVARCKTEEPEWREVSSGHWVACHLR